MIGGSFNAALAGEELNPGQSGYVGLLSAMATSKKGIGRRDVLGVMVFETLNRNIGGNDTARGVLSATYSGYAVGGMKGAQIAFTASTSTVLTELLIYGW